MDLNLKDKVAFVTGAGMGIAKAIALALAEEGAHISFMEIEGELLEQSRKEIESTGAKAKAILGSVTKLDDVRRAVQSTVEAFGKIDILINSAGASPGGDVLSISHEDWEHAFDVKFWATSDVPNRLCRI